MKLKRISRKELLRLLEEGRKLAESVREEFERNQPTHVSNLVYR